jgi:hypothetical protein
MFPMEIFLFSEMRMEGRKSKESFLPSFLIYLLIMLENCVILEFVNHVANCEILGFVSHVEKLCHFRVCCVRVLFNVNNT